MEKVSKGFFWSAVDHLSVQFLQFILSIIIARLVSPDAYGVIVMVQVFMTFAQVFIDGGFKSALIQKKDRTENDYYTVFIFNMIVAVALYLIMFIVAPYIAKFYNQPILTKITRVISLNLIFSSLSITQLVKLQATLDFKTQAKARVISVFISGCIGVVCAYKGFEAWALVIQSVLCTFLTSLFLSFFSKWKPRLVFSKESFFHLFRFGSKVLFSNLLTTFYMQVSNLIIGKFYTSSQLAYYNRAFTLSTVPSVSIVEVMGRTIYPIFCEYQDDEDTLRYNYRKYLRLVNYIVIPIMLIVSVLSGPIITVLLTEKWLETAPLLSILCVAFATYPIQYITGNFVLSVGRSGLIAKVNVLKQGIALALLICTLFISVRAVAFSLMASNIINVLIGVWCVKKVRNISIFTQLCYVLPIIIIALCSAFASWIVASIFDLPWLQMTFGLLSGVLCYVILSYFFKVEELSLFFSLFKKVR